MSVSLSSPRPFRVTMVVSPASRQTWASLRASTEIAVAFSLGPKKTAGPPPVWRSVSADSSPRGFTSSTNMGSSIPILSDGATFRALKPLPKAWSRSHPEEPRAANLKDKRHTAVVIKPTPSGWEKFSGVTAAPCYTTPMQYDFVAIGDITTDAFIKLKDAEELMNHGTRELCVRFADKVPYEEVIEIRAVGNAANAAVSAQRIGLSSALIARVGDDENGRNCRETLKGNGVSDEYVETQAGLPTNYHYVLWFGAERTILVKQTKFTYSMPKFEKPPKYIYLTSLGESAKEFHH